jgi:AcrR family transcriptional regulator
MLSDVSTNLEKRFRVVTAALSAFSRFGYRRTAMADIAAAAEMSRPALYLVFPNKVAVFRALAEMLMADAMTGAEAAWPETMAPAEGLAAAILAKDLPIHQLLAATPHAAEILAEARTLADDLHRATAARFTDLVTTRLAAAGNPEAAATARLVANAADGLKHAGLDQASYIEDVKRLAGLVAVVPAPATA